MIIKRFTSYLTGICLVATFLITFSANGQPNGEEIFQNNCASCHKVDGAMVGPALKGINEKKDKAWLLKWIKNSQAVIASGDAYGKKLYEEYNNTQMPAFSLSDEEITAVLSYIKAEEGKVSTAGSGSGGASVDENKPYTGYYLLLWFTIAVLIAASLYALRVLHNKFKLQGKRFFNWDAVNGTLFLVFLVVFFYFVYYQFAKYGSKLLPEPASEHGVLTDNMMYTTLVLTMFVFIVTHIMLFAYPFKYRYSAKRKATFYHDNHKLEFFWTLIPAVVLTALVLYGYMVWTNVTQRKPGNIPNEIEVFAYQFGWKTRYAGADKVIGKHDFRQIGPGNDLGVDSNDIHGNDDLISGELVMPVNKAVLLKFRARDVIHSAYLPHFRVQMNVVPGMPTEFYFVPTITTHEMRRKLGDSNFDYILLCNKICGAAHFNMKMKVSVVSDAEYAVWLTKQKTFVAPVENPSVAVIN